MSCHAHLHAPLFALLRPCEGLQPDLYLAASQESTIALLGSARSPQASPRCREGMCRACRMGVEASVSAGIYTKASLMMVEAITSCNRATRCWFGKPTHKACHVFRNHARPMHTNLKRREASPTQTITGAMIEFDVKEQDATEDEKDDRI